MFSKIRNVDERESSETPSIKIDDKNNVNTNDEIKSDLEEVLKQPLPEILLSSSPCKSSRNFQDIIIDEDLENEEDNTQDLVDVIKSMISEQTEVDKKSTMKTLDLSKAESKGLKSLSCNFGNKDQKDIQIMMQNVQNLFKCMSQFCSFTTNLAHEFKNHLYEVHSIDKKKNRHGWLRCSYCNGKLANPDYLTNHIIKIHAKNNSYQCQHCFHRDTSLWSLLIHQSNEHPGFVQGFLTVPNLNQKPLNLSSLPPYSASTTRMLKCQESQCTVQAKNPEELSNHLFMDHYNAKAFTDYQCAHCLQIFDSVPRLLIHVKLVHQKKIIPNMIIRHIDQSMTISDSEGNTNSNFKIILEITS